MISRRAARLARTFQLVALAVGAPSLATQCGTSSDARADGGADATGAQVDASDALAVDTAAPDPNEASALDAGIDSPDVLTCFATVSVPDATGPDGEEYCDYALPCGMGSDGLGVTGCVVLPT